MSHHLVTGGADRNRNRNRDADGRFVRIRHTWTPDRWEDGFLDNKGRFRVYRPDCPYAYEGGYALRYHVVWWLAGKELPRGSDIHHRNRVKTDDRLENLERQDHEGHSRYHNPRRPRILVCEHCGAEYAINHHHGRRPSRFCSQACYHAHPRSTTQKEAIAAGLRQAYAEGRR